VSADPTRPEPDAGPPLANPEHEAAARELAAVAARPLHEARWAIRQALLAEDRTTAAIVEGVLDMAKLSARLQVRLYGRPEQANRRSRRRAARSR
jgi:hypothetical protein